MNAPFRLDWAGVSIRVVVRDYYLHYAQAGDRPMFRRRLLQG
jgi:hypothetical protein